MMEDPVRDLCLYTHSVAECWLCLATSNVCSFVSAPPVCVSIDCMCVCVCVCYVMNTLASYSSLTDARPSDLPYISIPMWSSLD